MEVLESCVLLSQVKNVAVAVKSIEMPQITEEEIYECLNQLNEEDEKLRYVVYNELKAAQAAAQCAVLKMQQLVEDIKWRIVKTEVWECANAEYNKLPGEI